MDIAALATTISLTLAPFAPYLIEGGKKISEKAGEAAWAKAQELWAKVKAHFGEDAKVKGALTMVSADPADESLQKLLAATLAERLKDRPEVADELLQFLGGHKAIMQVVADHHSLVENITQQLSGAGQQTVKAADKSVIKGVRQIKK